MFLGLSFLWFRAVIGVFLLISAVFRVRVLGISFRIRVVLLFLCFFCVVTDGSL